jgi:hypothetical protein
MGPVVRSFDLGGDDHVEAHSSSIADPDGVALPHAHLRSTHAVMARLGSCDGKAFAKAGQTEKAQLLHQFDVEEI